MLLPLLVMFEQRSNFGTAWGNILNDCVKTDCLLVNAMRFVHITRTQTSRLPVIRFRKAVGCTIIFFHLVFCEHSHIKNVHLNCLVVERRAKHWSQNAILLEKSYLGMFWPQ